MPKYMVTSNIRHFPTNPMKFNSQRKTRNYECHDTETKSRKTFQEG